VSRSGITWFGNMPEGIEPTLALRAPIARGTRDRQAFKSPFCAAAGQGEACRPGLEAGAT
jgi:hypothetical protein